MNTCNVKEFVERFGVSIPPVEQFWRLGDLTGLRQNSDGGFYRANYERGILLYSLVAHYRPRAVLEFGTGRGYGSLCAARAMDDFNIDGRIFTVDMVPPHEKFDWAIDWGDGRGPRVEKLSWREVWPKAAPVAHLNRITELTGFAGEVMSRYSGPRVELAFIDGGHGHDAVRHDFYSTLEAAADHFGILFDDYAPIPGFGVQKLIDEEVSPHFDAALVYTDRRWPGGERAALVNPEYGMVWTHSSSLKQPLRSIYPKPVTAGFLRRYRTRERLQRLRRGVMRVVRSLAGR